MKHLVLLFALQLCLLSCSWPIQAKAAQVPRVATTAQTDPMPAGESSSDDIAIWVHPTRASDSLILGVNKNKKKEGGMGGLYVYDLEGRELQRFLVGRLNNVDLRGNVAIASNRDRRGISLFDLSSERGEVTWRGDLALDEFQDGSGQGEREPYGLCLLQMKGALMLFLAQKDGVLYQYKISLARNGSAATATLLNRIELRNLISPEEDRFIQEIVRKQAIFEHEENEIKEKLLDRFALEGCVGDDRSGELYVGMENLGIFKITLNEEGKSFEAKLWKKIKSSFVDMMEKEQQEECLTDDVEGLALYPIGEKGGYLFVSAQGINEYALYDVASGDYQGSFKLHSVEDDDPITHTDGLEVAAGMMVVHDDENTNQEGKLINANYKIASVETIFKILQIPQGKR